MKVREGGAVVNSVVLVATGAAADPSDMGTRALDGYDVIRAFLN